MGDLPYSKPPIALKQQEQLQEKKQNEGTWRKLTETYGEVIACVEDEQFYNHRIGISKPYFIYGESIRDMCEEYACYWLLDAIASYQHKAQKHPQMKDFQIWELKVDLAKHEAVLVGSWDTNQPLYRQRIEYTDFPQKYIKLYLEGGVLIYADDR